MLLRGDGKDVQRGAQPQRRLLQSASGSPGFAHLFGEHDLHLIAVLVPEGRRVAVKQRSVDTFGAHYAPGTKPVSRACFITPFNGATSAAASRFPKRVSRQ